ncbi:MAG: hypothetical protein P4L85_05710 [Paludisphaera borealis]|uniref:hypothetical protein n=1 Tax=Paludisphaera borealis TaxID=1387353 RepID=UPI00283C40DF|nr:hypothetical protein [Paludisphaera borealis]MDR3618828.1 hypothetical protein [Paludisphaera borealis]
MAIDGIQTTRVDGSRKLRADEARVVLRLPDPVAWCGPVLVALGLCFVLFGGADSDLRSADARIGLAASTAFSPLGQVFGQWQPDVWPLRVALSRLLFFTQEPGRPESGTVLWPSAVAGMVAGWIVARRLIEAGKIRMSLIFGFAWFGSVAMLDHSSSAGLDLVTGLATIAAIDRLLNGASDWKTGIWAALAFLSGGWPPLVLLVMAILVLGRREADFSYRLILPPVIASSAWLAWTIKVGSIEAAAAALAWPLTQKPDWTLGVEVFLLALPLAPFALLMLSPSLRKTVRENGSGLVLDWLQLGVAAMIGGTIIPGLATVCRTVALVGILVAAAAALEAAWSGVLYPRTRRLFLGTVLTLTAAWMVVALYGGFIMTVAMPYYRPLGVVVVVMSVAVFGLVWRAVETRSARRSVAAMLLMTVCLKLVHWGYYTPEWNYRHGQGPWGRAIGQWILPNWTLYTIHDWPEDLAWAIGRPMQQLHSPQHIEYPVTPESRHALLLESEFDNWPANAPKLTKVATFHDQDGRKRILARTAGVLYTHSGRIFSRVPPAE